VSAGADTLDAGAAMVSAVAMVRASAGRDGTAGRKPPQRRWNKSADFGNRARFRGGSFARTSAGLREKPK